MVFAVSRHAAVGAIVLVGLLASSAAAQNDGKPKAAAPAPDKSVDSGVSRYCTNVAPVAAEARIAWETRHLNELDAQIKQRIADLAKAEADTRDWVSKRDALLNSASDDVVAIYSKMDPEAAAAQMAAMDDSIAVSILHKLKVNAASTILNQMDAARAARLTSLILAVAPPEKKS